MERNTGILKMLDRFIGSPLLVLIGALRKKRNLPTEINAIGIFAFAAIGDSILSSGMLPALSKRFPGAKTIIFCSKANAAIYPLIEGFDQLVILPITSPLKTLKVIRQHPLDIVVDTSQWFRLGAIYAWLAKSRWSVGFSTPGQGRHYAYDERVAHSNQVHELENFQRLLIPLGCEPLEVLALRKDLKNTAELKFIQPGDSYVVFHPWASGTNSAMREWPERSWIELAHQLLAKGLKVVISGSEADQIRAYHLRNQIGLGDDVTVVAGKLSLKELANILLHAKACISVNTGIAHLSSALGVLTIALNGPTNSGRWGVLSERSTNLDVPKGDGGAFLNLGFEYPRGATYVMGNIAVRKVLQVLQGFQVI